MTGLETIGITAAAKGLTDLVVKPISEVLNKRLDEPFKQLIFNAFSKYVENYNDRHGILKVLGMPEPVKLEDVYTSVQFLGQHGLWRFDPLRLEEAYRQTERRRFQYERCKKQDDLEVANAKQYLMVLGQPGAGKSTFLKRIGLEALKGKQGSYQHECVPVFLELKRFTTGEVDIEKAIAAEFDTCGFPNPLSETQKLLEKGKLLILLDGLDEVPTQQLDHAISKIQDFADKYKQNRFIASCRTAAYQSRFRQFIDVFMADFDDDQIQQFITNWFRSEEDRQTGTAQSCWKLLQQPVHSATKELAQTPLLLTLLCLVFDDSQNFPEKRAELYKQALDVLLAKWAAEKRIQRDPIYKDLTLTLEMMMLGEIAYNGFRMDRLFFSQREVVDQIRTFLSSNLNAPKHLDGEVILQAIQVQQGILVERAKDVFSFSHLTLQEYLSAQHIADHNLIKQLVYKHLTDRRWREVFLLVAGVLRPSADDLLLQIEHQAQTFINSHKLQALMHWANQQTQKSKGNFKPAVKRAVAIFNALAFDLILGRARAIDIIRDNNSITLNLLLTLDLTSYRRLDFVQTGYLDSILELVHTFNLDVQEIKIVQESTFSTLIEQMEILRSNFPGRNTSYKVRCAFFDKISLTWHNELNIQPEWLDLSGAEIDALNRYCYAYKVMIQCKEAAVRVSPQVWEKIESRMLTVQE
jgi:hypothetical protein